MTDATETGVPYPSQVAGPVDEWSEQVYAALCDWPVAQTGEWTRWEPGYLLLTITQVDDSEVEPIVLYSADEERLGIGKLTIQPPMNSGMRKQA